MIPPDNAGPTPVRLPPELEPARWDSLRWIAALEQLHAALANTESGSRSRWTVEWAIHRWASEALNESTAIRIGESEGLSGPAPARWRLLIHIDGSSGAFSLAVLDGRAPRAAQNVIAALISDHCGRSVIAARDAGLQWLVGREPEHSACDSGAAFDPLELLIDALASGQLDDLPELAFDLKLAFALARAEALRPRPLDQKTA